MCKKESNKGAKCPNLRTTKHGTQKVTKEGQDPKEMKSTEKEKKEGKIRNPYKLSTIRKANQRRKKLYLKKRNPKESKMEEISMKIVARREERRTAMIAKESEKRRRKRKGRKFKKPSIEN